MSEKTDHELLKVLAGGVGEYTVEALQAAEEEYLKRDIPDEARAEIKAKHQYVRQLENTYEKNAAQAVNTYFWVKLGLIAFFVLLFTLIGLLK